MSSLKRVHFDCSSLLVIPSGPGVLFGCISLKAVSTSSSLNYLSNKAQSCSEIQALKSIRIEKSRFLFLLLNTSPKKPLASYIISACVLTKSPSPLRMPIIVLLLRLPLTIELKKDVFRSLLFNHSTLDLVFQYSSSSL
ncbi:hypothetical protein Scep_014470 [Stephania cephalantha]|uniref:Uncharacterized protein n=1 Tax=Stephania cephalantha TaxID=152367 RepID=A0AAP0J1B5_9MAGN